MSAAPQKSHLSLAIAAFVLLDLGTLAFSYTIARQVEKDAVAINLSGRQRMLSQRITKAALLATSNERNVTQRAESQAEMAQSYLVFRRTLDAFAEGGETVGGDGQPVVLEAVQGKAALLVGNVRGAFDHWPLPPADAAALRTFCEFMKNRNGEVLDNMNRLTSELEHQSVAAVSRLRIAQTAAFTLSLANFVFILIGMQRARREAEAAAHTDVLTGLWNRGGLYQELETALARQADTAAPLGVMLLDLDGFKAVNDTYGHAAGDAALRETAHRLRDWCRPGWICGRLGGDEFAVICPDLPVAEMANAANDLSRVLSGIPGGDLIVSASVGWAASTPGQAADTVIAAADAMMYAVKGERRALGNFRQHSR